MKLRAAASVLATVAALTACSSSSKGGGPTTAPTTGGPGVGVSTGAPASGGGSSDFCGKLTSANSKLATLPTSVSGGDFGALKTAIDQEKAAFEDLDNGAPSEVKPAIDDIVTVLGDASGAVADPTNPDVTKLQGLATKLPTDLTALANYLSSNCTGS